MSKSLVGSIVLVLSVICVVNGETSVKVSAPQKNPDHPNKCWHDESQTAFSVGSHNPKGSCQRIHCYPDFRIKETSCGAHSAGEEYTIEQDLSKVYPDCCPKMKSEKKAKRVNVVGANAVKINRFRGRERAVVTTEKTPEPIPVKEVTEQQETPKEISE